MIHLYFRLAGYKHHHWLRLHGHLTSTYIVWYAKPSTLAVPLTCQCTILCLRYGRTEFVIENEI